MNHSDDTSIFTIMDIDSYLNEHENKSLLRVLTCGSVDDGKSTLIGRLLYDSKLIFDDQLAELRKASEKMELLEQVKLITPCCWTALERNGNRE